MGAPDSGKRVSDEFEKGDWVRVVGEPIHQLAGDFTGCTGKIVGPSAPTEKQNFVKAAGGRASRDVWE